jgi:predicted amidohydrolase
VSVQCALDNPTDQYIALPSAVLVYTNRLRNATTYLYFEETIRQARAGAQIVVWPEHAAPVAKEDEPALVARAQEVARQEGIYLFNGDGILRTAATPYGVLSGVICWDTDFPSTVLQTGRNVRTSCCLPASTFGKLTRSMLTWRSSARLKTASLLFA